MECLVFCCLFVVGFFGLFFWFGVFWFFNSGIDKSILGNVCLKHGKMLGNWERFGLRMVLLENADVENGRNWFCGKRDWVVSVMTARDN